MSQNDRPVYSDEQIQRYLDYIGKKDRISDEACNSEEGLKYLNEILALQLAKVPFENLDLHYSLSHTVSLNTEHLFHKIVDRKAGRGGYCMQNNLFFLTILRSLGYKVMPCGSRVSNSASGVTDPAKLSYGGFSHTVTIVHIQGKKYFVDTGFGNNNPSTAIPLQDGWTGGSLWKDHHDALLTHAQIPENTNSNDEQKLWIYHKRSAEDQPWLPQYCFAEVEFLPQDFEVMNYYVSHSLKSFFTYAVVARLCILDEEGRDVGQYTLFNGMFKKTIYGKSEILLTAKSESERIESLEKYFGIKLDATETEGVKGYITMLNG